MSKFYHQYKKISYIVAAISLVPVTGYASMSQDEEDNEVVKGVKMSIYKTDKGFAGQGLDQVGEIFIDEQVGVGPAHARIRLKSDTVAPNADGHFLGAVPGTREFDGIAACGIAMSVEKMYMEDVDYLNKHFGSDPKVAQALQNINGSGRAPLDIYIRAMEEANAFYAPSGYGAGEKRELRFGHFNARDYNPAYADKVIYTEQAPNVVAHEFGHSALDLLRPSYMGASEPQTGGFHESFGDLTAIFHTLYQNDLADKVILKTSGNLHRESFLSVMAAEFGLALGMKGGLRHADRNITPAEAGDEVHDLSEVFTGAIYDVLASAFHPYIKEADSSVADALKTVSTYLRRLMLHAIIVNGVSEPQYGNIAFDMARLAQDPDRQKVFGDVASVVKWKDLIEHFFAKRSIALVDGPHAANAALNMSFGHASRICKTMGGKACVVASMKALAISKAPSQDNAAAPIAAAM